jgi:hypothetical protein
MEWVLIDVILRLDQGLESVSTQHLHSIPTLMNALSVAMREGLVKESTTAGCYLLSHVMILASFLSQMQQYFEPSELQLAILECFVNLKSIGKAYSVRAAQHANEAAGS